MDPSTCYKTREKQARLDRSGAAEGQAAGSSPSSGQDSPATLLDLSDAHGLVYKFLPKQSRAAFRQCCKTIYRSPSINARFKALHLGSIDWTAQPLREKRRSSRGGKRDYGTYASKTIMNAIASFPKHATLKHLSLIGGDQRPGLVLKINFRKFLTNAETRSPVSEAARKRLCTVEVLDAEADSVNADEAGKLIKLLPQLEELRLRCSQYSNDFFTTLADRQCNLTSLVLHDCKSSDGPFHAMEGVSLMTTLRSLELESLPSGTRLYPLTSLQSLQHLSVRDFKPFGLGQVVSSVPLESLDLPVLDGPYPRLPPEHLVSSTLTTLCIRGNLLHLSDWISMLECPSLKFLHFKRGISLCADEPLENEDVLERVGRVAVWLGQQGLTWTGRVYGFRSSYSNTQPFPASSCTSLFKRLFPLAHQLGSIRSMSLGNVKLCHASVRDVATLFPRLSHLTLQGQKSLCSSLRLPELLAYLPVLTSIRVNDRNMQENGVEASATLNSVKGGQDILDLLCAARDGRRKLSLQLAMQMSKKSLDRWSDLRSAWEAEASKKPMHASVRLSLVIGGSEEVCKCGV